MICAHATATSNRQPNLNAKENLFFMVGYGVKRPLFCPAKFATGLANVGIVFRRNLRILPEPQQGTGIADNRMIRP